MGLEDSRRADNGLVAGRCAQLVVPVQAVLLEEAHGGRGAVVVALLVAAEVAASLALLRGLAAAGARAGAPGGRSASGRLEEQLPAVAQPVAVLWPRGTRHCSVRAPLHIT